MTLNDAGDLATTEIRKLIVDIREQIHAEENKLNQLESLCCVGTNYNDTNDYPSPAWFNQ